MARCARSIPSRRGGKIRISFPTRDPLGKITNPADKLIAPCPLSPMTNRYSMIPPELPGLPVTCTRRPSPFASAGRCTILLLHSRENTRGEILRNGSLENRGNAKQNTVIVTLPSLRMTLTRNDSVTRVYIQRDTGNRWLPVGNSEWPAESFTITSNKSKP